MVQISFADDAPFAEDITIGLTLLSLRYEGLRMSDYEAAPCQTDEEASFLWPGWLEGRVGFGRKFFPW